MRVTVPTWVIVVPFVVAVCVIWWKVCNWLMWRGFERSARLILERRYGRTPEEAAEEAARWVETHNGGAR